MTREKTRPTLDIQLISEQLPETRIDVLARTPKPEIESNRLTLYPGEPNELQIRLDNSSGQEFFLTFYLEFESYLPKTWFWGWSSQKRSYPTEFGFANGSIKFWFVLSVLTPLAGLLWVGEPPLTQGLTIAANSQQYVGLHFSLPNNFFELDDILNRETPTLERDHPVTLEVYRGDRQTGQLVGYRFFQLEIRPRSTYVHFLPALYRQVNFFDRFLKIMEEAFDPAVQTSDCLWAYLDPLTAPEDLLPFLAHWVGWTLDSRLETKAQRQLIRNAVILHRLRGTQKGLRLYLHWVTGLPLEGDSIEITSDLNAGLVLGKTHLGDAPRLGDSTLVLGKMRLGTTQLNDAPRLGGGTAYHFQVRLRSHTDLPIDESIIREIIQEYKPAFSTYELAIEMRSGRAANS